MRLWHWNCCVACLLTAGLTAQAQDSNRTATEPQLQGPVLAQPALEIPAPATSPETIIPQRAGGPLAPPNVQVPVEGQGGVNLQPIPEIAVDVSSRYRWRDGYWWFQMPSGQWMIHQNGQWVPFDPATYVPNTQGGVGGLSERASGVGYRGWSGSSVRPAPYGYRSSAYNMAPGWYGPAAAYPPEMFYVPRRVLRRMFR